MSSQELQISVEKAAGLLLNIKYQSAPAAEKSTSYCAVLPSPSSSVLEHYKACASARESTAEHACSSTSPSRFLPTPRLSRGSTWNCQSPTEDKEAISNHASSTKSLSRSLLTPYTSPGSFVEHYCPTSLTQQHRSVEIPERMLTLKSYFDLTDDEEGATTTIRDITCHGNTYLNLVPHAGCASWELARQNDPASIGVQPKSKTPTLEDHNGELKCPRCRSFQRFRTTRFTSSRSERESTVPLTEEAQDCIKKRRIGAAEYDDDYHEKHYYKLLRDQVKRQQRYILAKVMKPETRARREAERAVRLEQQREAPYERAYEDIRRNRDAETAQIRAVNKAKYDREKAMVVAKPKVSWEQYLASLPTPDPQSLEAYTRPFVPRYDMVLPPNPANVHPDAIAARRRPVARARNVPRPIKRTLKAEESTASPPTDSTPSPPGTKRKAPVPTATPQASNKGKAPVPRLCPQASSKGKAPAPTTPLSASNKGRATVPTTPLPASNKRKPSTVLTTPGLAKKRTKPAAVDSPSPPTRVSPRSKKPNGGDEEGIVSASSSLPAGHIPVGSATEGACVGTSSGTVKESEIGQSSRDEVGGKVGGKGKGKAKGW